MAQAGQDGRVKAHKVTDGKWKKSCAVTPRRLPDDLTLAVRQLGEGDPAMTAIMEAVGPFTVKKKPADLYQFCRAILGQQLSVQVADKIAERFAACAGCGAETTPERVLALSEQQLRQIGLSGAKVKTIHALASFWQEHELSDEAISAMSDEEIVSLLTQVKGIGPWTVKMILIFCLRRPDVLPVEDLGLRMGMRKIYEMPEMPAAKEVEQMAERWRPWRTLATWYCWQALKL